MGKLSLLTRYLGPLLTKLVSENKTNWDEHLSTMLISYIIAYKVAIGYTPYQLVYGLHPLMPIEYIVPVVGGDEKDSSLLRVLNCAIIELKKL
jgi:hypothetical protein